MLTVMASTWLMCVYFQEDIHEEYVEQELKREWNSFKHGVVVDVINNRGIRPGYGKWTK